MAKVLVIGASGGIGLEVVKAALEAGHVVRAMARSAGSIDIVEPGFEPFAGDALDPSRLGEAVRGVDAVVHALGVRVTPSTVLGPVSLFSRSTLILVPAMHGAGVRRLIAVTGFGTGDSRAKVSAVEKLPLHLVLGRVYADKGRQEEIIRTSGLDWTIARPGFLTRSSRTGRYCVLVEPESWRSGLISRADVADFAVSHLEDPSLFGKAPVLV